MWKRFAILIGVVAATAFLFAMTWNEVHDWSAERDEESSRQQVLQTLEEDGWFVDGESAGLGAGWMPDGGNTKFRNSAVLLLTRHFPDTTNIVVNCHGGSILTTSLTALSDLPRIEKLALSWYSNSDNVLPIILRSPSLRRLTLIDCKLGESDIHALIKPTQLTQLNLKRVDLSYDTIDQIKANNPKLLINQLVIR